jgi:hypothetical protein
VVLSLSAKEPTSGEMYGAQISVRTISTITDKVMGA